MKWVRKPRSEQARMEVWNITTAAWNPRSYERTFDGAMPALTWAPGAPSGPAAPAGLICWAAAERKPSAALANRVRPSCGAQAAPIFGVVGLRHVAAGERVRRIERHGDLELATACGLVPALDQRECPADVR